VNVMDTTTMQVLKTIDCRRGSLRSVMVVLDETSVSAFSFDAEEEDRKARFPGLKRDYDSGHRIPPTVNVLH